MIASLLGDLLVDGGAGRDDDVRPADGFDDVGSGIWMGSSLDMSCRKRATLDCRDVNRAGWVWMVDSADEAVVASIAGRAAEKTEAAELILLFVSLHLWGKGDVRLTWCLQTWYDPAQNPPPAPRPLPIEPISISTSTACLSALQLSDLRRTHWNTKVLSNTSTMWSNHTKRVTLVQDQSIPVLPLQFHLHYQLILPICGYTDLQL